MRKFRAWLIKEKRMVQVQQMWFDDKGNPKLVQCRAKDGKLRGYMISESCYLMESLGVTQKGIVERFSTKWQKLFRAKHKQSSKENNEIYEGDLILCKGELWQVTLDMSDGMLMCYNHAAMKVGSTVKLKKDSLMHLIAFDEGQVVGNIYESW